jgi:uncharacterized protein YbjT (DUF2867 family)
VSHQRIAVIGATGLVRRATVAALEAAGHEAVPVSRSGGIDVLTGAGPADALAGVRCVIDVTNTPDTDPAAARAFFGTVSANLLAAERTAGVEQSCGTVHRRRGPGRGQRPLRPQTAATQFFDFAAMVVEWTRDDGVATVPPLLVSPIAVADVAATLAELATGQPVNGTVEVAGPQQQDLVDMARRTLTARGDTTRLATSWHGIFGPEMAGDVLLPGPDARTGATTFDQWLATEEAAGDGRR